MKLRYVLAGAVGIVLLLAVGSLFAQDDNALVSQDWRYDRYFEGTSELGVRTGRDAWTWTPDKKAFVVSCAVDRVTQERTIHFFVKMTGEGLHRNEAPINVKIKIDDEVYPLDATVGKASVDTFSVLLPNFEFNIIEHMRRSRRFTVIVPCASCGVSPLTQEFSLMGFNKATLNTITNCRY